MRRAVLSWALLPLAHAMVVNRIYGPNFTELSHLSVGGGGHVYITGVELGTPFAPPAIRVGPTACVVQGFTSTRNRLHCIIEPAGLLPPTSSYQPGGTEGTHGEATALIQNVPLFVVGSRGIHADCWHVGGLNHGCFLKFDTGGTPRLHRVLTPVLQQGALVRVTGEGIDGGLSGMPRIASKIQRALDSANIACDNRDDEDVEGPATVATDPYSYGCKLRQAPSEGGFYNVSLVCPPSASNGTITGSTACP